MQRHHSYMSPNRKSPPHSTKKPALLSRRHKLFVYPNFWDIKYTQVARATTQNMYHFISHKDNHQNTPNNVPEGVNFPCLFFSRYRNCIGGVSVLNQEKGSVLRFDFSCKKRQQFLGLARFESQPLRLHLRND